MMKVFVLFFFLEGQTVIRVRVKDGRGEAEVSQGN